jgi:hypothetical protein
MFHLCGETELVANCAMPTFVTSIEATDVTRYTKFLVQVFGVDADSTTLATDDLLYSARFSGEHLGADEPSFPLKDRLKIQEGNARIHGT